MKPHISNLAKEIGISQGFFSNILAGRRRPHYRTGKDIARVTLTTVELWMEGDPADMRKAVENYHQRAIKKAMINSKGEAA
ncbi:helix-turn-helix domain-containing protein [Desulfotignum phosphitoxidans]|nr:helix-turn-helix transcriptional regulator [Desulfotignum phosphitoxidans]